MDKLISITELEPGKSGEIASILGGAAMCQRLSSLGLHIGVTVTRVGKTFARGPVTVDTGQCQIAIGYGQARRVLVKVSDDR